MSKRTTDKPSMMIGKKAPTFNLPDQEGRKNKLADYKGKYVVVYWDPKDSTPGFVFTQENCIAA